MVAHGGILVPQCGSSLNSLPLGFCGASLHGLEWLNYWPLMMDSAFNPSSLREWDWKFQPSNHMVDSPGNKPSPPPPSLGAFWKSSHWHKAVLVERGLLWITGYPFHLHGSEAFSGTEDKRPNILTKDVPIPLTIQEIPRVLGAVSLEPQWRPNMYFL